MQQYLAWLRRSEISTASLTNNRPEDTCHWFFCFFFCLILRLVLLHKDTFFGPVAGLPSPPTHYPIPPPQLNLNSFAHSRPHLGDSETVVVGKSMVRRGFLVFLFFFNNEVIFFSFWDYVIWDLWSFFSSWSAAAWHQHRLGAFGLLIADIFWSQWTRLRGLTQEQGCWTAKLPSFIFKKIN